MPFDKWLDTFLSEKGIDLEDRFEVEGPSGPNFMAYQNVVDVGVDCKEITHEYRPIHLDEVLAYMKKREKAVVDHHSMPDED